MQMRRKCVIAFAAGFSYEAICTAWAIHVARSDAAMAAIFASLAAACIVFGIERAIASRPGAVSYVLGCGLGAAVSVIGARS